MCQIQKGESESYVFSNMNLDYIYEVHVYLYVCARV